MHPKLNNQKPYFRDISYSVHENKPQNQVKVYIVLVHFLVLQTLFMKKL